MLKGFSAIIAVLALYLGANRLIYKMLLKMIRLPHTPFVIGVASLVIVSCFIPFVRAGWIKRKQIVRFIIETY